MPAQILRSMSAIPVRETKRPVIASVGVDLKRGENQMMLGTVFANREA
jgi:hypothetical protein